MEEAALSQRGKTGIIRSSPEHRGLGMHRFQGLELEKESRFERPGIRREIQVLEAWNWKRSPGLKGLGLGRKGRFWRPGVRRKLMFLRPGIGKGIEVLKPGKRREIQGLEAWN